MRVVDYHVGGKENRRKKKGIARTSIQQARTIEMLVDVTLPVFHDNAQLFALFLSAFKFRDHFLELSVKRLPTAADPEKGFRSLRASSAGGRGGHRASARPDGQPDYA